MEGCVGNIHSIDGLSRSAVIPEVIAQLQTLAGSLGLIGYLADRDDDEVALSPHDLHCMVEMLRGEAVTASRKLATLI